MIKIGSLLQSDDVIASSKALSKKQVLQEISHLAAQRSGVSEQDICRALLDRERLGSTGMGKGIALPHARMPVLKKPIAVFARLERPVDFDAPDNIPVDLIFMLLVPTEQSELLQAMAQVARQFRADSMRTQLRSTGNARALHALLTSVDSASGMNAL